MKELNREIIEQVEELLTNDEVHLVGVWCTCAGCMRAKPGDHVLLLPDGRWVFDKDLAKLVGDASPAVCGAVEVFDDPAYLPNDANICSECNLNQHYVRQRGWHPGKVES